MAERSMTQSDVLDFYIQMENLGIKIWIDGGWGVDDLLGCQTRSHGDLDIAIQQKDVKNSRHILEKQGYKEINRESEWNFVLGDDKVREIDFHAFVFDGVGRIIEGIQYPDGSLTGSGMIGGHAVNCISPEHMVKFHSGYPLRESDFKDVFALCKKFDIDLPDEFVNNP
jgi:lincosamide nucleotidyltransferase A/C/D/E